MQEMAPPDYAGSDAREDFASYRHEPYSNAPPVTPDRRRPSPDGNWTNPSSGGSSSRHIGQYREDYSRAQHASLNEQQQHHSSIIHKASSDVGPPGAASPEHMRFSAYVNRFASHDPRTTPVHTNTANKGGVSVSERIARFNNGQSPSSTPLQPPANNPHQPRQRYRTTPHPRAKQKSVQQSRSGLQQQQQEQALSSSSQHYRSSKSSHNQDNIGERHDSSNRRQKHLAHAQERYRSRSAEPQKSQQPNHNSHHQQQQHHQPTTPSRSHSRRENERVSSSQHGSSSRERSTPKERTRSQSSLEMAQHASHQHNAESSPSSSPSDSHRAARSILAKRRQRRLLDQEAKQEEANDEQQHANGYTGRQVNQSNRVRVKDEASPVVPSPSNVVLEEGRTDRILREARSRSMSPRASRYSRRKVSISITTPQHASPSEIHETPETPTRNADYHHRTTTTTSSTPPPSSSFRSEIKFAATPRNSSVGSSSDRTGTPEKLMRAVNTQSAASIAVSRPDDPVSPMTPGSTATRSPNARLNDSGNSVITSGSNTTSSTVQDLKRQLWDNNETLQVSVKPSLVAHGYSDRRTKQTTEYYAPEMAGREGQRVRSLSPNPRRDIHGHEQPAGTVGGVTSMFNSKFYQAALASHKENPQQRQAAPTETPRNTVTEAPSKPNQQTMTKAHRRPQEDKCQNRTESPRPPTVPSARGEPWRPSGEELETSQRRRVSPVDPAVHSIERVPSSAGVSTATGEASVAKLVARLSSVSREDPERALQMIDTILRAESVGSIGRPGSRASSRSGVLSPGLGTQNETTTTEDDDDDEDNASESSGTSCDDTSVSSITNPTYQRDEKAMTQVHVASTSSMRNPRPSALNKYAKQQLSPPSQEETRGKSSKTKKEKKPPPPMTINVGKSDAGSSHADKRANNSIKEKKSTKTSTAKGPEPSSLGKEQRLDPYMKLQSETTAPMDAAAIAMKIKGWDEQLNSRQTPPNAPIPGDNPYPLSPTQTHDTARTEELGSLVTSDSQNKQTVRTDELGSIVTSHSQSRRTESEIRRTHPWDDRRAESDKSPMAIDLKVDAGTRDGVGNSDVGNDAAFVPTSPWRRRRAAKEESEPQKEHDIDVPVTTTGTGQDAGVLPGAAHARERLNRRRRSKSPGKEPTSSTPKVASPIAPNVYDIHRNRRSRSKEKHHAGAHRPEPPLVRTSSREGGGLEQPSRESRRPKSTRSEPINPFDSAWTELPPDSFPASSHHPSRPGRKLPDAVASAFSNDVNLLDSSPGGSGGGAPQQYSTPVDLPPRAPSINRVSPFGKEELQETSREGTSNGDHHQASSNGGGSGGGGKLIRRSLMKFKRSSSFAAAATASKKKPLLSAYAMNSVDDHDGAFVPKEQSASGVVVRGRNTDGGGGGSAKATSSLSRRSRTLSPAPRSVLKSPSVGGASHGRPKVRNGSLPSEDETQSLTGSLTGSSASSVRNKNLAKKFSRFLKVYED